MQLVITHTSVHVLQQFLVVDDVGVMALNALVVTRAARSAGGEHVEQKEQQNCPRRHFTKLTELTHCYFYKCQPLMRRTRSNSTPEGAPPSCGVDVSSEKTAKRPGLDVGLLLPATKGHLTRLARFVLFSI
jgi:hypothetical protein